MGTTPTTAGPPPRSSMTRLEVALFVLLLLASGLGYVDRQVASVVSPALKEEFGLTDARYGLTNSAFYLVYFVTSVLGGLWIDRVGVRKGLLISLSLWSLAAAGHALTGGFLSLCLWRMLLAVPEGPGYTALLKGARRLVPLRIRDTGAALVHASTLAGSIIAPTIAIPLTKALGWRAAFLLTGALGLAWLPLWAVLAYRPGAELGPQPMAAFAHAGGPPPRLHWRSRALWASLLLIFFTIPPTVFVNIFLPLYLSKTYLLPLEDMTRYLWQPFLCSEVGQLTGAAIVYALIRRGWRFLSARRFVLCLGFPLATVVVLAGTAPTPGAAFLWVDVSRFCFMMAYTILIAYGMEAVAENQTGLMSGLMNGTFALCNVLFSPLMGGIADRYDYKPVLWLIGLSPLIGLACWLVLSHLHARHLERAAVADAPPVA